MRIPRIYIDTPLAVDTVVTLDAPAANHVVKVLRLRPDDPLVLFNGSGGEYRAQLSAATKREVTARIAEHVARESESPLALTLAQSVSKGEKMDYTIQKAVELGVQRIVPVVSERTVVHLTEERLQRRLDHWRAVMIHACEQCGRNTLPELAPLVALSDFIATSGPGLCLVLYHRSATGLHALQHHGQAVTLLVGPEGGWSEAEVLQVQRHDFHPVVFGPRVMRTETAAVAAISAIQTLWGDMG